MKHIGRILLLTGVLLALGIPALAASFVYGDVFSFEYPDGWKDFGAETSQDVPGSYYEAAFLGGRRYDALNVTVRLYYDDEYENVRLFSDGEAVEELRSYIESTYYDILWSEIVRSKEHGIPFVVVHGVDSAGESLYAETLNNGWSIVFEGYAFADTDYDEMRALTQQDVEIFCRMLESFKPAVKERG